MGKVFQHYFSTATDAGNTIASSKELNSSICAHLEKTVCALKCQSKGEAVYITPLTSDAIVIGKCTCYDNKKAGAFYHNYIISNTDAAKIINDDPYFFSKIIFNDSSNVKDINADSLDALPLSDKGTSRSDKISGIMLQNAYCAFMDIVTGGKMKYMSADESFSPMEIIGIAYTVLPIHVALGISFVTCSDGIPAIKYNFCFVEQGLFHDIAPQNKVSSSSLFSSEQTLSIASFPRMSRVLEDSPIGLNETSVFYRFAYDFINIINKYSGNQLDPLNPELYEPVLCVYTYVNSYVTAQKKDVPADILTAIDWLDKMIETLPSMENEIRRLVPKTEIIETEEQSNETMTTKRAEREMATKIIGLISANPTDYKSFVSIKYQVMREARMETISLSLFQSILRSSLLTMFENEMDDSKITMAAMAVSLAFETVDYRIFGSECISYAPYDYDAMIEFILMLPLDSRLVYNEVISLHKKADMLSIALSNHKKPTRRKKAAKQDNNDDSYSDEEAYADKKLEDVPGEQSSIELTDNVELIDAVQNDAEQNNTEQNIAAQDNNAQNDISFDDIDLDSINFEDLSLEDINKIFEESGFQSTMSDNESSSDSDNMSALSDTPDENQASNDTDSAENNDEANEQQETSAPQSKGIFGFVRKKNKNK